MEVGHSVKWVGELDTLNSASVYNSQCKIVSYMTNIFIAVFKMVYAMSIIWLKKKPNFLPNILNPIYVSRPFLTITQDFPAILVLIGLFTASPWVTSQFIMYSFESLSSKVCDYWRLLRLPSITSDFWHFPLNFKVLTFFSIYRYYFPSCYSNYNQLH